MVCLRGARGGLRGARGGLRGARGGLRGALFDYGRGRCHTHLCGLLVEAPGVDDLVRHVLLHLLNVVAHQALDAVHQRAPPPAPPAHPLLPPPAAATRALAPLPLLLRKHPAKPIGVHRSGVGLGSFLCRRRFPDRFPPRMATTPLVALEQADREDEQEPGKPTQVTTGGAPPVCRVCQFSSSPYIYLTNSNIFYKNIHKKA
eukprot:1188629-Prorocentrum_minimum.AAC.3